MGGLYINDTSFVKLICLYWKVNGMCVDVVFCCRFCGKWMTEYIYLFFILNSLLIWTDIIEVIVGRWDVWEEADVCLQMVLSLAFLR